MRDVDYTSTTTDPLTLHFGKDADFKLIFKPDTDVALGSATVKLRKMVNFVCESNEDDANRFSFSIRGSNGTVVDSGSHETPCEVHVIHHPEDTFASVSLTGDDHRYVLVQNDPWEDENNNNNNNNNNNDGSRPVSLRMGSFSISGTFFEVNLENAVFSAAAQLRTLIGALSLRNVTVPDGAVLATGKGNVVLESREPLSARFVQPREHVCAQAPSAIAAFQCDPGMMFDTCAGANGTMGGADGGSSSSSAAAAAAAAGNGTLAGDGACRTGCSMGTVAVGSVGPGSATVTVEAVEGGVHVRHLPLGSGDLDLAGPWHGFGGPKMINFTSQDYEVLSTALHGEQDYDMLNIFIDGPGAPEGLFLWGRRDIYLKIHPPVLNMASAGLLNPITLEIHATLSPAFCPAVQWSPTIFATPGRIGTIRNLVAEAAGSAEKTPATPTTFLSRSDGEGDENETAAHILSDDDAEEFVGHARDLRILDSTDVEAFQPPDLFERKVATWRLLKDVTNNPDDTQFAIREGCIGNFVFDEDPRSGRVSKVQYTWLDDPTVVAVGVISVGMALATGIVAALVVKSVYRSQVKGKRQELLVRLRSLKSQGYYPLGGGYFVYHSPPDRTRWKRDFYIGDPFGRILALRSMRETPKSFVDVFRSLNGQSYQTVRIQIEDESAVKRARRKRRERELSSSLALTEWYRGLKLQRGLEAKAKALREDYNLARRRAEVLKNVKRARLGVLDGQVTHAPGSLASASGAAAAAAGALSGGGLSGAAPLVAGANAGFAALANGLSSAMLADDDEEEERLRELEAGARQRQEDENAAAERREETERKEQSKLEARARKAEMAEEERLVAFFVGPFMFMEIFVETLALALIPGLQAGRDFDKDAIAAIKKLMQTPTRQGTILALSKAFRIRDANMRGRAIEYIKNNGRSEIDTVNRMIREYHAKRGVGSAFGRLISWIGREKASQILTVTAHILVLLTPPILLIIFGFMLVNTWSSSPITAQCFTGGVTALPIFLIGFLFYFLAYTKLIFFYLEKNNQWRLRLRKAFDIYTGFLVAASVTLLMVIVFWVLLGLLLNPEKAAAPATAIGTMVSFVLTQYRRLKEIRDKLREGIKDFIEEKFARYVKHIENLDDVIDRVVTDFGFSLRNVVVMIFAACAVLGSIFAFIFLGIAVFEGKGAAMALIQSSLTAISGLGYSLLKGKEGGAVKDNIKVKVPGLLKDLLQSILEKGMDMMVAVNAAANNGRAKIGANKSKQALDDDQDIEVTATLYGAIKLVERQDAVSKALEFPILKVGQIVEPGDHALTQFWETAADDALVGGLGTARGTARTDRSSVQGSAR